MRTSLDLCVCLLTLCGITPGLTGPGVKVVVKEGSDAVLPCSPSTKEDITGEVFDWKKDGLKEVFIYENGKYYGTGFTGQVEQFTGRVSHFQDQLMNGNASIKIQNTKMADSGNYRCIFPHLQLRQTFNIELVVEPILRDRSGEISGASPKPHIATLYDTKGRSLLQCEVRGVFPKPEVEWQDSAGNILPAEEPQVSEIRGSYYVTLLTTVTKTGRYRCVATQEDISHQIYAEIYVLLNEDLSRELERWRSATIVLAGLLAVLLLVVALMGRRYSPLMNMLLYCRNIVKDSPLMNMLLYCQNIVKGYRLVPPPDDPENDCSDLLRRRRPRDDLEIAISHKSPLSNVGALCPRR